MFWIFFIWVLCLIIGWKLDNEVKYTPLSKYVLFYWFSILSFALLYQLRTEGFRPLWGKYEAKDYGGNDIQQFRSIGLHECKKKCVQKKDCQGIVTNYQGDGRGYCWLKKNMVDGKKVAKRWSYNLIRE